MRATGALYLHAPRVRRAAAAGRPDAIICVNHWLLFYVKRL
jgi:hypothetical protein